MWSIIQAAGWPIWPLILFSIAAVAIVIERIIALRFALVLPKNLTDEVLQNCGRDRTSLHRAVASCGHSVLGELLAHTLRALHEHPRLTPEDWRVSFEEAGRLAQARLLRYLGALATIASAAPLLGLLGTVIGMIEIFAAQSAQGAALGDPTQLAHGISVALYNTAFGLLIAVPSLIAWRALRARVDTLTLELELQSERFWRSASALLCTPSAKRTP